MKPSQRISVVLSVMLLSFETVSSISNGKFTMNEGDLERRFLQAVDNSATCYSTYDERNPNRYCTFDNTPRANTFLQLSCPDSDGTDLAKCSCNIGVGDPEDAPNTPTCNQCAFCGDGTLAYDCRNVAEGSCIGRNCAGECITSLEDPSDITAGAWSTGNPLVVWIATAMTMVLVCRL